MRISDWSSDVCSSDLWCHDIETGKIEFCILHLPPSHPDHQSPRSSERSQQLLRAAAFEFARSRAGGVDIPEIGFELLIVDAPDRHRLGLPEHIPPIMADALRPETGRASRRERVGQYVGL